MTIQENKHTLAAAEAWYLFFLHQAPPEVAKSYEVCLRLLGLDPEKIRKQHNMVEKIE